jgi:hypothetical protein
MQMTDQKLVIALQMLALFQIILALLRRLLEFSSRLPRLWVLPRAKTVFS